MRQIVQRRPSPSMVVALLALFVALSGSTYAAIKLPRHSVGSKQLKKGAVTGSKIKKNSVTSNKIKAGALDGSDINLSTVGTVPSAARASTAAKADDATALGGQPASAFQARWLLVEGSAAGATVLDSSGGFSAQRTLPGAYFIDTGAGVAKKSLQATATLGTGPFRQAQVSPCGTNIPGGFDCNGLAPGTNDGRHIVVRMTDGPGSALADGAAFVSIGG